MNQPALYTEINGPPRSVVEDLSNEFIEEFGKMSGSCIDVGSGPGDVVADLILPKMNPKARIICSDISENMVNYGKEKYNDNKRMSFMQLNIEIPKLPEHLVEQFDHVMSFYCIHWCQNMRQVFENIFNLLRPGGSSFVTFICRSPFLSAYEILAALPRYQPYMKDAHRYIPVYQHTERPRETLRALLEDVGFGVQHCSIREKSWIFNTREDFIKFLVPLNPFIDRIPADIRDEYVKDLVRVAAKQITVFNENHQNDDEFSVLLRHNVFVLHLNKSSKSE